MPSAAAAHSGFTVATWHTCEFARPRARTRMRTRIERQGLCGRSQLGFFFSLAAPGKRVQARAGRGEADLLGGTGRIVVHLRRGHAWLAHVHCTPRQHATGQRTRDSTAGTGEKNKQQASRTSGNLEAIVECTCACAGQHICGGRDRAAQLQAELHDSKLAAPTVLCSPLRVYAWACECRRQRRRVVLAESHARLQLELASVRRACDGVARKGRGPEA